MANEKDIHHTALECISEYLDCTYKTLVDRSKADTKAGYIEIEARIGKICSNITLKRLSFSTLNPIVFYRLPKNSYFDSKVDKDTFDAVLSKMGEPTKVVADKVLTSNKIRKIVVGDEKYFQEKVKIGTVDVYLPGSPWDVRISVSREVPLEAPASECKWSRVRCRKRWSFERESHVVDLTEVKSENKRSEPEYEIEWEVLKHEPGYKNFINEVFKEVLK